MIIHKSRDVLTASGEGPVNSGLRLVPFKRFFTVSSQWETPGNHNGGKTVEYILGWTK